MPPVAFAPSWLHFRWRHSWLSSGVSKNPSPYMNTIARTFVTISAILSLTLAGIVQSPCAEEMIAPGMLDFRGVHPIQALQVYKDLTGAKLYVDSRAERSHAEVVCKNEKAISKAECARMIEQALLEQAAVVVTKLDDNRVSVTFNDSLPIKPVERKKGS